jgi:hypothetical protein
MNKGLVVVGAIFLSGLGVATWFVSQRKIVLPPLVKPETPSALKPTVIKYDPERLEHLQRPKPVLSKDVVLPNPSLKDLVPFVPMITEPVKAKDPVSMIVEPVKLRDPVPMTVEPIKAKDPVSVISEPVKYRDPVPMVSEPIKAREPVKFREPMIVIREPVKFREPVKVPNPGKAKGFL